MICDIFEDHWSAWNVLLSLVIKPMCSLLDQKGSDNANSDKDFGQTHLLCWFWPWKNGERTLVFFSFCAISSVFNCGWLNAEPKYTIFIWKNQNNAILLGAAIETENSNRMGKGIWCGSTNSYLCR